MVKKYQKAFAEVISCGTHSEKRKFTRLFMKQIDLNPDTAEILMDLYSRPPGLLTRNNTPASNETGVPIGVVAQTRLRLNQILLWIIGFKEIEMPEQQPSRSKLGEHSSYNALAMKSRFRHTSIHNDV